MKMASIQSEFVIITPWLAISKTRNMTRNLEPVELPKYAKCCLFSCFIIDTLTWIHVDQGATLSQPASLLLLFLSHNIPLTRVHFIKYVSHFSFLEGLDFCTKIVQTFRPYIFKRKGHIALHCWTVWRAIILLANDGFKTCQHLLCTSEKYWLNFFLWNFNAIVCFLNFNLHIKHSSPTVFIMRWKVLRVTQSEGQNIAVSYLHLERFCLHFVSVIIGLLLFPALRQTINPSARADKNSESSF